MCSVSCKRGRFRVLLVVPFVVLFPLLKQSTLTSVLGQVGGEFDTGIYPIKYRDLSQKNRRFVPILSDKCSQ